MKRSLSANRKQNIMRKIGLIEEHFNSSFVHILTNHYHVLRLLSTPPNIFVTQFCVIFHYASPKPRSPRMLTEKTTSLKANISSLESHCHYTSHSIARANANKAKNKIKSDFKKFRRSSHRQNCCTEIGVQGTSQLYTRKARIIN